MYSLCGVPVIQFPFRIWMSIKFGEGSTNYKHIFMAKTNEKKKFKKETIHVRRRENNSKYSYNWSSLIWSPIMLSFS